MKFHKRLYGNSQFSPNLSLKNSSKNQAKPVPRYGYLGVKIRKNYTESKLRTLKQDEKESQGVPPSIVMSNIRLRE